MVTARSSWAREGLNIATATLIEPGYRGIITLELANFGEIPIRLYPGLRLAQVSFYKLDKAVSKSDLGDSQFDMSFEPKAGQIVGQDRRFVPAEEKRKDVSQENLDQIAKLRSKELRILGQPITNEKNYSNWEKDLLALRKQIHRTIKLSISRAEADTFFDIGIYEHVEPPPFYNDEHAKYKSVIARDSNFLEELIKDYARKKKRSA